MLNLNTIKEQFLNKNNHVENNHIKTNDFKVAIYARVSSKEQSADLKRKKDKLIHYCQNNHYHHLEIITDLGSGLNYKKKGLNKLINLILNKKINILVINHKDRLLRFGSELIFNLCKFYQIKVIVLEHKDKTFEEDLTTNVIELMTVFCAKLYGRRSHKNKLKSIN